VHFMRNALAKFSKGADMVARPSGRSSPSRPVTRPASTSTSSPTCSPSSSRRRAAAPDAKADLTAFADFPHAHWQKIWSTNPLERLNRRVKRRTDVVGHLPQPRALLRLSACVLIEAHDEWQDSDRRDLSRSPWRCSTRPHRPPSSPAAISRAR
jgi:putative transposase